MPVSSSSVTILQFFPFRVFKSFSLKRTPIIHGNPNSLETIARCDPAEPVVQRTPLKSDKIGPKVVVPASSTKHILPVALSNKLITSSTVFTNTSAPTASDLDEHDNPSPIQYLVNNIFHFPY